MNGCCKLRTESGVGKHGYFADPRTGKPFANPMHPVVRADWCRDGTRDMVLARPVLYVAPDETRVHVPTGTRFNGLSSPRLFWRFCQPYEGVTREASVVHDYITGDEWISWGRGAWIFYHAMRAGGAGPVTAWLRWAAVAWVGVFFQGWFRNGKAKAAARRA